MKQVRKSKTISFAAVLGMFGAVQATLPGLQIDPEVYGYINMGVAVAIAYLRFVTTQPVK